MTSQSHHLYLPDRHLLLNCNSQLKLPTTLPHSLPTMIHLLVQQPQNLKHRNLQNGRYHLAIIQCASEAQSSIWVCATDNKVEEYSNCTNAGLHQAYVTFFNDEPRNYHEAMQSPHSKEWEIAIATEYKQW